MNVRALTTAALLLACAGGAAFLDSDERNTGVPSGPPAPAREAGADHVTLYRNGDLELNIRGRAGIDMLGSGLANVFRDEQRQKEDERRTCAQEPLPLGMLGASLVVLGWTRRRGSWVDRLKQGVFPWPALCWLD